MLAAELDFDLPPRLIAQQPARPRDAARLMRVRCNSLRASAEQEVEHRRVRDLSEILQPGDLLVVNDSRVLRARLRGVKPTGGRVEAMLLREEERNVWQCLLKPSARISAGTKLIFHPPHGHGAPPPVPLVGEPLRRTGESWLMRFVAPAGEEAEFDVRQVLADYGEVPLPPYIQSASPEEDYQTVYARSGAREEQEDEAGALDSCAAPTAGLHFTPGLLRELEGMGVEVARVTLAVGPGTFRPVQSETLEEHAMHAEEFWIAPGAATRINAQKQRGGRVVAVGTTSLRALESAALESIQSESEAAPVEPVRPGRYSTSLFVRPPFSFRVADALLTNFHLPRSTLLALVAAWAQDRARRDGVIIEGLPAVLALYRNAVAREYRFFSFGDAMLLD
jgi:S-adenosylmethionine:tRNA ribosyltransferase-isomerase